MMILPTAKTPMAAMLRHSARLVAGVTALFCCVSWTLSSAFAAAYGDGPYDSGVYGTGYVSSSSSTSSSSPTAPSGGGGGGHAPSYNPNTSHSQGMDVVSPSGTSTPTTTYFSTNGQLSMSIEGRTVIFRDVPDDSWFYSPIGFLLSKNIAQGYKSAKGTLTGIFGPANPVTEAEILKMALISAGVSLSSGVPLNESAQGDWSADYVNTAEDLHLSVYDPSLNVTLSATRGEVIQTILEAFNISIQANLPNPFVDLSASDPHFNAIKTAAYLGIISGDTDANGKPTGFVRPSDSVNRAEAAKIIELMLQPMSASK